MLKRSYFKLKDYERATVVMVQETKIILNIRQAFDKHNRPQYLQALVFIESLLPMIYTYNARYFATHEHFSKKT